MNTVTLGPARIGEAALIATMSRELIEAGLPHAWTARRVAAHMRDRETMVVAARQDARLVGFAMAHFGHERVHITLIGVDAAYQRQGIGRKLLAWVEESAVVAGLFTLHLEVRTSNRAGRNFYRGLGYEETAVRARYYSGMEDAVVLVRDLCVNA